MALADGLANPIRLLIVDDHTVVRAGLRMLIECHDGMTIVGEAGSCAEALQVAARTQPEIILLDLDLGGDNGLRIMPELLAACEGVRVLVLTGVRDDALHRRALRSGAMGVVPKEKAAEVLIKAIGRVHAGEAWIDRATMGRVLAELSSPTRVDENAARAMLLTSREREVVALVAQGLKNKHIGERLFISETTVRHHLTAIFDKLEVSDRLELLIFAYRYQLAPLPTPPR
jgi:two-component system, NarL family, nitrate/nitrite response regulator NarL